VTDEGPRYSKRDEMEGPNGSFTYSAQGLHGTDGVEVTLARLQREYGASCGLTFSLANDGPRLNVLPDEVADASGKRIRQAQFSTPRSLFRQPSATACRSFRQYATSCRSRRAMRWAPAPSAPVNSLLRCSTAEGIDNLSARTALAQLLDCISAPGNFVWGLYHDPAHRGYGLNLDYVSRAQRVGDSPQTTVSHCSLVFPGIPLPEHG